VIVIWLYKTDSGAVLLVVVRCPMNVHFKHTFSQKPCKHSWASASRKLTAASAFRHPLFQSGTGPKKCRTASAWSGTGSVPASLVLSFRYRTDRIPDSLAFQHLYIRTRTWTPTRTRTRTRTLTRTHGHGQGHRKAAWTLTWKWACTMDTDKQHGCRND
jgi:hypothetical protein